MKIQIKSIAGSVLFEGDFSCIADAVKAAIKSYADLSYADLRSADLSSADLRYADLRSANLSSANLSSANLRHANLRYADLSSADLSSANLRYANLRYANLSYAKNSALAIAMTRILPEGDLIGWKKCANQVIVKLRIPLDAKRSHAFGRKCRAEFVDVLEVIGASTGFSTTADGPRTAYSAGVRVTCNKWCENFTEECAGGIHFFITREEAAEYVC